MFILMNENVYAWRITSFLTLRLRASNSTVLMNLLRADVVIAVCIATAYILSSLILL